MGYQIMLFPVRRWSGLVGSRWLPSNHPKASLAFSRLCTTTKTRLVDSEDPRSTVMMRRSAGNAPGQLFGEVHPLSLGSPTSTPLRVLSVCPPEPSSDIARCEGVQTHAIVRVI